MKKLLILMMLLTTGLFAEGNLNTFFEMNKFLDEDNNTIFDINYQIYNNDLVFNEMTDSYIAEINIEYSFIKDGKIVKKDSFNKKIGAINKVETESKKKFYLDKIGFTLNNSFYSLSLKVTDINSEKFSEKVFELTTAEKELISDFEFSSNVSERDIPQLQSFVRKDKTYFVNPAHIFSLDFQTLYIYFEMYGELINNENYSYKLLKNKEVVVSGTKKNSEDGKNILELSLDEFSKGYYSLEIAGNSKIIKTENFMLKEAKKVSFRLLDNIDDDLFIIGYFSGNFNKKKWKHLDKKNKETLLRNFWLKNDPNPTTEDNEFYQVLRDRLDYTDSKFGSLKAGWKTDRGRIYLKNGKPDDIVTGRTTERSRFIQKDYEVWNFYKTGKSFIFLNYGHSYKLIYVKNDDTERSVPNWEKILGDDFDMSVVNF